MLPVTAACCCLAVALLQMLRLPTCCLGWCSRCCLSTGRTTSSWRCRCELHSRQAEFTVGTCSLHQRVTKASRSSASCGCCNTVRRQAANTWHNAARGTQHDAHYLAITQVTSPNGGANDKVIEQREKTERKHNVRSGIKCSATVLCAGASRDACAPAREDQPSGCEAI